MTNVLPEELRALAKFCDSLNDLRFTLLGEGNLSLGPIPIFDANGEGLGAVDYSHDADQMVFVPE